MASVASASAQVTRAHLFRAAAHRSIPEPARTRHIAARAEKNDTPRPRRSRKKKSQEESGTFIVSGLHTGPKRASTTLLFSSIFHPLFLSQYPLLVSTLVFYTLLSSVVIFDPPL
jgi:hypothetical protein